MQFVTFGAAKAHEPLVRFRTLCIHCATIALEQGWGTRGPNAARVNI